MKKLRLLSTVNGGLRRRTIVITDDDKADKLREALQKEIDSYHQDYINYTKTLHYRLFEMKQPLSRIVYDSERKSNLSKKYKFIKRFRLILDLTSWFNFNYIEDEQKKYWSLLLINNTSRDFNPVVVIEPVIYFNEEL